MAAVPEQLAQQVQRLQLPQAAQRPPQRRSQREKSWKKSCRKNSCGMLLRVGLRTAARDMRRRWGFYHDRPCQIAEENDRCAQDCRFRQILHTLTGVLCLTAKLP